MKQRTKKGNRGRTCVVVCHHDDARVVFAYLWSLLVCVPLLGTEDQSLGVSETGEGFWRNLLHLQEIIFQVDRSQGGAQIMRVAHSPLPHQPETTTYTTLKFRYKTNWMLYLSDSWPGTRVPQQLNHNCCFGLQCYCVQSKKNKDAVSVHGKIRNCCDSKSLVLYPCTDVEACLDEWLNMHQYPSLLFSLEGFPKGAALPELMILGMNGCQAWKHYPCTVTQWWALLYLIWLLSSLSTCRFLNCRTRTGTSHSWLLSNRSSPSERYVPTKETCSIPSFLKALWDRLRERRPGCKWRNTKAGMRLILLCWRLSVRRGRGRFIGTEVNWLWDRSKVSKDLRRRNIDRNQDSPSGRCRRHCYVASRCLSGLKHNTAWEIET